jgi:UV DNA damage endonuclease
VKLGFAVKVLGRELPSHDTRRWQSGPHLRISLERLDAILDYLDEMDIRMYRMPTALAPYASHPEMRQFRNQPQECGDELAQVGAKARRLGIRLSTHPGQYTVLNSENPNVVSAALDEFAVQGEIFDAMGLGPDAVVVTHVGGVGAERDLARERFVRNFERLTKSAKQRLVVENDDRSFDINDAAWVAERTGRPVVWDILHHTCYNPTNMPEREALRMALDTWPPGVTPKIHFSSPRTDIQETKKKDGRKVIRKLVAPALRAHADLIDPIAFKLFLDHTAAGLDLDVMLEAKGKDLALLRLREQMQSHAPVERA